MGIDKIKNWLKKSNYSKYGIKTEINPAITLFGMLTVSMGKLETDPNPDKWSEKEKNSLADFLKRELKMSYDEFYKHYIDEYRNKTNEQINSILSQIADKLTEKPLISLEEFEKRTEIKKLLEYKKFIGRKEDLKELYSFLQDDRKTMLVTGEGGSGKTRLAIEFARQVEDKNWQVYFINANKSFKYLGINSDRRKILIILDDASRCIKRDKVIDFALNPPLDIDIKLLLLDRPIFNDDIESKLTQRYQFGKSYQIKNGDIVSFLEEYFGIEKKNAVMIEKSCRNSFVWAAFFAEDYKKSGKIRELKDILKARTEIYIEDISVETDLKMKDVKRAIYILSLFTPINWSEDKKYFENNLFSDEYKCLEKIIGTASWGKIDILNTTNSNHECSIVPDPVADFLRFEFIKKDRFFVLLKELLPYMPFRLSYNIFVIPRYTNKIEESINLLGEIWKEINLIKGQNLEYFSALIFLMSDFTILPSFDIKEANIKQWILCYKKLIKSYPKKEVEVREGFTKALVNAVNAYGRANDFTKMAECLKELRGLHEKYGEKEIGRILSSGLYNATSAYGRANNFTKIAGCLKELRGLHEKYEEKEIREKFAKGLYNAVNAYGIANDLTKMEDCLKELRGLHEKYEEKKIKDEFAKGLLISLEYLRNGKNKYRNFCLLYKLISDLSACQNKEEYINEIEDFFILTSKELLEDINVKDEKSLKEFANLIKGAAKNQAKLEFLLNKIIEKNDIKKKKKLWQFFGL